MNKSLILDHDIGTNPDDFFALLMLLNSNQVNLSMTISGNGYPNERARLANKIISQSNKPGVESFVGKKTGRTNFFGNQFTKEYEPQLSSNYVGAIKNLINTKGEVIYLCIQGLSNLAQFAKKYPKDVGKLDIIHMGLTTKNADNFVGGGTNMEADPMAAKYIYELGLPNFRVVGSHTTINDSIRIHPDTQAYKKLSESGEANHGMLLTHLHEYNTRRGIWPALHDPLTASVALTEKFVDFEEINIEFRDDGSYRLGGNTKVLVSKEEINNSGGFMDLVAELV